MNEQREAVKTLEAVFTEITAQIQRSRQIMNGSAKSLKDFRWQFDQESSLMNQAIFNNHIGQIHESCLKTIAALVEILTRT
jgi:ribosome recycling factor